MYVCKYPDFITVNGKIIYCKNTLIIVDVPHVILELDIFKKIFF